MQLLVLVALLFITFQRSVPQLEVPEATQRPPLHWRPL